jgi:hypothetical protein
MSYLVHMSYLFITCLSHKRYMITYVNKKKNMWKFLIFIFLSLESNFAGDCGSFVVDDCDRNLCENRAVNNIASPDLCQILCTLTVDFTCQSFAYSRAHQVSLLFWNFKVHIF